MNEKDGLTETSKDETPSGRDRFGKALRRYRLPEVLLVVGLVLVAVAGMSMWAQANSDEPGTPAPVQPTPFPTLTPVPTALPTPTVLAIQPSQSPPPLPTLPPAPTRIPAVSVPTRIVIPSIELDAPVVEIGWRVVVRDGQSVTEWEVANDAAGFHRGSAYPGNPGNTVLSGHHNVRGKVFRYLVNVQPGDEIILYADGRPYYYKVESVEIVPEKYASEDQRRRNARLIGYYPEERLTLVTCWPYTSNTHRVIVVAKPAPAPVGTD